jgi:hypothetical protein
MERMISRTPPRAPGLRKRAYKEIRVFLLTALYLWILLGSFTVYRRLILAETGVSYLHYGIALIEALIIAKVILVGRLIGFSRRFEDQPLIVPVVYKSFFFGALVLLFGILEHLIEGWIHSRSGVSGLHQIVALGADELMARVLILMVALVPFFAFSEIGRVLGTRKLAAMFFQKPGASSSARNPS